MILLLMVFIFSLSAGCSKEHQKSHRLKVDEQNEQMLQQGAEAETLMKKLDNNVQDIQQQTEDLQKSQGNTGGSN